MQFPDAYDDDILGWAPMPPECDGPASGPRVYSLLYPPIGFFPFYEIGNGDCHGFYWAPGKEDKPPLVTFTSHDVGSVIPENSGIEQLYLCRLSCEYEDEREEGDSADDFRRLAELATGRPQPETPDKSVAADDFVALLEIDPHSPFLLAAVGDLRLMSNDPETAIEYYSRAVSVLPEYVAAHFGLVLAYRRTRDPAEAVRHLRETLLNRTLFYGGSFWRETWLPGNQMRNDWQQKSLMWLQRSKERPADLADDPFLDAVNGLQFETGVKQSDDFPILQSLIDQYAQRGQFRESVRLWLHIAERAAAETTSFRERLGLTPRVFATRLSELFREAGLDARARLTDDMLGRMDKPDGLYL